MSSRTQVEIDDLVCSAADIVSGLRREAMTYPKTGSRAWTKSLATRHQDAYCKLFNHVLKLDFDEVEFIEMCK